MSPPSNSMRPAPADAPVRRRAVTATVATDPRRNGLIRSLPDADWQRWRSLLVPVHLVLGKVLHEQGAPLTHAYFPTTAIIAMLYVTESGASASIATVGREGMVGVPLFMGGGSSPSQAVVQASGEGFSMTAAAIRDEFESSAAVATVLLRYTQALIAQMAQTAVCNRHHSVDQQLCRWLLRSLDRLDSDDIVATHEQIAHLLGVRREGVTEAALALQRDGLISYRRGLISVLDRPGLETRSCECYAVVRSEYVRLLGEEFA